MGYEVCVLVSYFSHSFPSFFGPTHLGKSPKWKVESLPRACSQVLHWATAMAAAATHKHRKTTQDDELALPDCLHEILISHNRSTGLGICPTRLKLFSLSLSVPRLSGLPLTLVPSKVEMAIGSAEWLKAGELFSQVPAKWGEQLERNSNPLEELKDSSPFPLRVTPPPPQHPVPILWLPTSTLPKYTQIYPHTHTHHTHTHPHTQSHPSQTDRNNEETQEAWTFSIGGYF